MSDPDAPWQINTVLIVVLALLTLIGPVISAVLTYRIGLAAEKVRAQQTELDARKVDHVRIAALEARVDSLESKRREDAVLIRRMGDHIDTLEDHIRQGKPPPPPTRPEGV